MADITPLPTQQEFLRSTGKHLVKAFRLSRFPGLGRRWTQAEAAAWWGCSERQWRRYENGQSTPPRALIKRIARGAKKR